MFPKCHSTCIYRSQLWSLKIFKVDVSSRRAQRDRGARRENVGKLISRLQMSLILSSTYLRLYLFSNCILFPSPFCVFRLFFPLFFFQVFFFSKQPSFSFHSLTRCLFTSLYMKRFLFLLIFTQPPIDYIYHAPTPGLSPPAFPPTTNTPEIEVRMKEKKRQKYSKVIYV